MNKVAVDNAAKDYWKTLYGEYGEALVRDIPRRIKAALHANKKVASVDESADLYPIGSARHGDGLLLEGLYKDASKKYLFRAQLDKVGNVTELHTIEVR